MDSLCRITRGASPRPIIEWIAPEGMPWIKIGDASAAGSRTITKTKEFIRPDGVRHSVSVHPGDLIVSNSATPGIPKFVGLDACIHDGWLLLREFHETLPEFLYYRVIADREELIQQGNGSVFTNLKTEILKSHVIDLPPIEEQRGIAGTLGALDDKIESNRRAIDHIQDLSRSNYVSWRSAHADARETTFGEFADVFGGATPMTTEPDYWDGEIAWATPTDITALTAPYLFGTARMITDAGLASTSATLHPQGTIFMTSRATIGSFAVTQVPAATNQGFITVRPREPAHLWFLFEEMRARVPEMLDRANGSTFMELSRGNFKLMPVGVPDKAALTELDADLAPLHAKAAQLDRESSRLAKLRDTLLPELLSGRIHAPEAEQAVEGATA